MATGSGKTVVMAMLIAWQILNKVSNPRDARFSKTFLLWPWPYGKKQAKRIESFGCKQLL